MDGDSTLVLDISKKPGTDVGSVETLLVVEDTIREVALDDSESTGKEEWCSCPEWVVSRLFTSVFWET